MYPVLILLRLTSQGFSFDLKKKLRVLTNSVQQTYIENKWAEEGLVIPEDTVLHEIMYR